MVLWGICMTTMGLCHNFQGLMAARFFLGLAEAGLFPGMLQLVPFRINADSCRHQLLFVVLV